MIVYAALFCDCVYESSYETLSLHKTYGGAKKAVEEHKKKEAKKEKDLTGQDLPTWMDWDVEEYEILDP